jgi:hypothetical protein
MSIRKATRLLTAADTLRVILLLALCASLVGVLVCWLGISRPAWAQSDPVAPSLSFRVEQLEAEVKEEGEPATEVVVRNGNDKDNDLEFEASLRDGGGLHIEPTQTLNLLGDPSESGDLLKSEIDSGKTIATARVFVLNNSSLSADHAREALEFSARLRDSKGKVHKPENLVIKKKPETSLNPYAVTPVNLEIELKKPIQKYEDEPLKGYLVVSSKEMSAETIAPGTLPLTLSEAKARAIKWHAPEDWIFPFRYLSFTLFNAMILTPFLLSFLVLGWRYRRSYRELSREPNRQPARLRDPLVTRITADFDKSWASILTIAAGIFAAIQGAEIFPEARPWFSKDEIAGLSLYFAVMLVFAPGIYNIFRKPQPFNPGAREPRRSIGTFQLRRRRQQGPDGVSVSGEAQDFEGAFKIRQSPQEGTEGNGEGNTKDQGRVGTFLIASSLILGAIVGQLLVGFILILQIETAVSDLGRIILGIIAWLAILAAFIFAWRKIRDILAQKADPQEKDPEDAVMP